jgi:ubiquitin thioesterase otulin
VEALSLIQTKSLREDYLLAVMNQSPELDLQLMEAVKALMMLKAIDFHELYTNVGDHQPAPVFSWLMFSRKTSETPQTLFHNHINNIGDTCTAGSVSIMPITMSTASCVCVHFLLAYSLFWV